MDGFKIGFEQVDATVLKDRDYPVVAFKLLLKRVEADFGDGFGDSTNENVRHFPLSSNYLTNTQFLRDIASQNLIQGNDGIIAQISIDHNISLEQTNINGCGKLLTGSTGVPAGCLKQRYELQTGRDAGATGPP